MTTAYKILLLGAGGQVGQAIQLQPLPQHWELHALKRADLDITHVSALRDMMQRIKPDLVINSAGLTNVDQAEKDPAAAMAANFEAVANLAAQCAAHDKPLIHLSTDYVFDGRDHTPYAVDAPMNPINHYGASKLLGEEAIRQTLPWHVILRISSVFSLYGRNILTNLLQMLPTKDEIRMVTDIQSNPTPAMAVAECVVRIARQLLDGKAGGYGTFHFCGQPDASRYDFAAAVLAAAQNYVARLPTLHPAKRAEFAGGAERPAYTVMDCSKLHRIYGISQPDWQAALKDDLWMHFDPRSATA